MSRSQLEASRGARQSGFATALALLALVLPAGCATTSLLERTWREVRTPHYAVVSSLSEADTLQLARDVESFRKAVGFTVGAELPPDAVPTRIVAFDGRGLERPFDVRGKPGYLLPRLRGDLLVLRTGAGWRGDARLELRVRYARHLLRRAGSLEWRPWVASGFAQVAGTTRARGDHAAIGLPYEEHVRRLRQETWVPVDRVLAARHLRGWDDRERALFDAEAWAVAHALRVGGGRSPGATPFAGGLAGAADHPLGPDLERELRRYVRRERLDSFQVRMDVTEPRVARVLSRSEVLAVLGELSVALERADQARSYFQKALAEDPASARVHAGLAATEMLAEHWEAAAAQLERATGLAPADPLVWLERGALHQARADASADPSERARLAEAARDALERSLALEPKLPETHARLAATALLDGGDPARALAPLARALALRPGSLEAHLLLARVHRARGDTATARTAATRVLTSSRSRSTLRQARELLDALEVARNGS